jgi:hypothetical protein
METVRAHRKPDADQAEAEKIANAAAAALQGRLAPDGFWIDRERGSYAYAFPSGTSTAEGRTAVLEALDQVAPADESKSGWQGWLEIED